MKISETISRIRNIIKAVKEDAFLTNRFIYSLIIKHGYKVLQKEMLHGGLRYSNIFVKLPFIELIDIDKIDIPSCFSVSIQSCCKIKKSKYPLPKTFSIDTGPLIRTVSSLDYSKKYYYIHPENFNNVINISINKKWNKQGYFFLDNEDYLYIFNDDIEAVLVEGLFIDYSKYVSCDNKLQCMNAFDFVAPFPDHAFSEIEAIVLNELSVLFKIPSDVNVDDNKAITK